MPRVVQAPPPGIFRNATAEASSSHWFDCNNIRWRQGQMQPIGGCVAQPNTVTADLPRDLITWHDNRHVRWAAFGTDVGLYAYRFDLQQLYTSHRRGWAARSAGRAGGLRPGRLRREHLRHRA